MRMYDVIKRKRDGLPLTEEEIRAFVRGYTRGEIPDYQASALCMAIWYRGMTVEETTALTLAIRDSGEVLSFPDFTDLRVDKHSTGGVGDKTSLVIAPIVAALGVRVAKMSGRGLGHTGGTVDKLESFAGLRTDLSTEEFMSVASKAGLALVGQSANLAPADKKLYALRDVTATVDSLPLIASSIMGKKLAANDDCILLDVKCGSGSFMKTEEGSRALARLMVEIGKGAGKRMRALLTNMDRPLGQAIGNSLEVIEAIEVLSGRGPADLRELCLTLASHMLQLVDRGTLDECRKMAERTLLDGSALRVLADMVECQGGDPTWVYDTGKFPRAPYERAVLAPKEGYIAHTNAEEYGLACLTLGAGRSRLEDEIDHSAGIYLYKRTGDYVKEGEPIAMLFTSREASLPAASERLLAATVISSEPPSPQPLVYEVIK
ncbi:MAG: thymidine phosphorylase [Clostridia bacterium]|nr:thymidine phosphorylase [Clostridia bacterium]